MAVAARCVSHPLSEHLDALVVCIPDDVAQIWEGPVVHDKQQRMPPAGSSKLSAQSQAAVDRRRLVCGAEGDTHLEWLCCFRECRRLMRELSPYVPCP